MDQVQKRDSKTVATRSRRIARTATAAAFVIALGAVVAIPAIGSQDADVPGAPAAQHDDYGLRHPFPRAESSRDDYGLRHPFPRAESNRDD